MSSVSLLALFCGTILLTMGVLGIVYLFVTSRNTKKESEAVSTRSSQKRSRNWLLPIIIAIVTAFWNVSLAIVFLLIVWVLRLDPKKALSNIVSDEERKICEENYKWLRNSSFLTVPIFFTALFMEVHPAVAAILPFVIHLPLIRRLQTENLYVYRHTQQALFLLLLRAGTAIAIFNSFFHFIDEGFLPFVIVNGSLWLFGTNWEVAQVKRNDSWLMRRRGEEIIVRQTSIQDEPKIELDDATRETLKNITPREKKAEITKSITAFRHGTREERKKATLVLAELGEVEKF